MAEHTQQLLSQRLIQQGDGIITVSTGGVPILYSSSRDVEGDIVVMAVNFLRAGCPAVQLLLDTTYAEEWYQPLEELLGKLALPKESFHCEVSPPNSEVLLIVRCVE